MIARPDVRAPRTRVLSVERMVAMPRATGDPVDARTSEDQETVIPVGVREIRAEKVAMRLREWAVLGSNQ